MGSRHGSPLNHSSYDWDFESALAAAGAPAPRYNDKGSGHCHGPANTKKH